MIGKIGDDFMAFRNVFYVDSKNQNNSMKIEFRWYPGLSISQKQKSIQDLHEKISKEFSICKNEILEISSKSEQLFGRDLSAFNLRNKIDGIDATVEAFFQSSKVFEYGGPFNDIIKINSRLAKKDPRLKESGKLICFKLFDEVWPLEPKTLFYDWLYINAVHNNPKLHKDILKYSFFTDIEFNPVKSYNCQAKSAALYVSLYRRNLLEKYVLNKEDYLKNYKKESYIQEKLL